MAWCELSKNFVQVFLYDSTQNPQDEWTLGQPNTNLYLSIYFAQVVWAINISGYQESSYNPDGLLFQLLLDLHFFLEAR